MKILHSLLGLLILVSCTPLNGMDRLWAALGYAPKKTIKENLKHPKDMHELIKKIDRLSHSDSNQENYDWKITEEGMLFWCKRRVRCTTEDGQKFDILGGPDGEVTYTDIDGTTYKMNGGPNNDVSCIAANGKVIYTITRGSQNRLKNGRIPLQLSEKKRLQKEREEDEKKILAASQEDEQVQLATKISLLDQQKAPNSPHGLPPAYDQIPSAPPQDPESPNKLSVSELPLFRSQQPINDSPPPPSSFDRNSIIVGAAASVGFLLFLYCVKTVLTKSKPLT